MSSSVSLVLACYNEADIFDRSMGEIDAFFDNFRYDAEYVFVDDSSTDGTRGLVREYVDTHENARAIYHDENQGRGQSVTDGIRAATHPIVGFLDIDLEIGIHEIYPLIRAIERGSDVACGYRHYKLGIDQVPRAVLSWSYKYLTRVLLGNTFRDTEAGCKFFRRERILPVLDETAAKGWFWDTEVMLRAREAGLEVAETPVLFVRNPDSASTVSVMEDVPEYARNIWYFRRGTDSKLR